jgi:hypothetical protein
LKSLSKRIRIASSPNDSSFRQSSESSLGLNRNESKEIGATQLTRYHIAVKINPLVSIANVH